MPRGTLNVKVPASYCQPETYVQAAAVREEDHSDATITEQITYLRDGLTGFSLLYMYQSPVLYALEGHT